MKPRAFWSGAFFRDREPVRARVNLPPGWTGADATIFARHPRGTWTRWRTVETLKWVGVEMDTRWSLRDDEQFSRWAFADFCFEATVHDGERTRRLRSGLARHYARTVGFYGFGPVGERWSNAEIRRVARATGGAAVRPRDPVALRRLARCVPPGEQGMRLFGYSLGGRAAVRLARGLARRGVGVELLVGIDPVDLAARTLTVPPNVRRAVSFYQRNGARIFLLPGPAGRGLTFTAAPGAPTTVENHRLETWRPASGQTPVMHEDMPRAVREELTALLSREQAPASDPHAVNADPRFVDPGKGGIGKAPDELALDRLDGYQLQTGSPCIGAGVPVPGGAKADFWGHPIGGWRPSIGADEPPRPAN